MRLDKFPKLFGLQNAPLKYGDNRIVVLPRIAVIMACGTVHDPVPSAS